MIIMPHQPADKGRRACHCPCGKRIKDGGSKSVSRQGADLVLPAHIGVDQAYMADGRRVKIAEQSLIIRAWIINGQIIDSKILAVKCPGKFIGAVPHRLKACAGVPIIIQRH